MLPSSRKCEAAPNELAVTVRLIHLLGGSFSNQFRPLLSFRLFTSKPVQIFIRWCYIQVRFVQASFYMNRKRFGRQSASKLPTNALQVKARKIRTDSHFF